MKRFDYGREALPLTITLASLASDSNLLAGRSSAVFSNLDLRMPNYLLSGKITLGTSPTSGKSIEVWAWACQEFTGDNYTYPDAITGSDAAISLTSTNVKNGAMVPITSLVTGSTSNRTYYVAPISVASLFGGVCPPLFGIWVAQNSGANLNSSDSNHRFALTPVYSAG